MELSISKFIKLDGTISLRNNCISLLNANINFEISTKILTK